MLALDPSAPSMTAFTLGSTWYPMNLSEPVRSLAALIFASQIINADNSGDVSLGNLEAFGDSLTVECGSTTPS